MGAVLDLYFMLYPPVPVAQAIQRLWRPPNSSRWGSSSPMPADRLHVTLVPLGRYAQRLPNEVVQVACRAASILEDAPFPVSLDLLQSRGPEREVGTVELAGHGSGVLPLHRFRRRLAEALQRVGWPPDMIRRNYHPHITLDYRHEPVSARRVMPVAWDVTEFRLVASHYGEGRHEVLGRWPLCSRQMPLFA